ncbi:uncharacterized protein F54H12.2-like [Oculina patagonica]
MESLSLQADKGQYDYRPQRKIDATEYKWQFEDIKPLTHSSTPLQFRIDDRPYPFCPREMELHLRVKFKEGNTKALAYHNSTSNLIVGPVNNFGYSCIRQVRCKVNNAETESASGVNLAYREYFRTLLESDPWDEKSKLKRQGWYRDVAGQMDKWGGKLDEAAKMNAGGISRQRVMVNTTGEYEFNVCPMPSNFTQVDQNVPPNTKVEFDIEFNNPEFALMAKKYKDNGDGTAATSSDKVSFEVMVNKSFVRVFYRVPVKDIMQYMEEQVEKTTVVNPMTFPFRRMRCDNYQLTANQTQLDINDVFRGRSPRLFWLVLVDDERYQGHFGKNPFDFTPQNGIQVECTANGVPVPKASLSLQDKYEIFDLLMNASGKRKRDAYLLNPDTFDQGYFMVPFDLTAVQDGGESSTPLLRMLVNVRLTFSSGNPTLQALFFYNTDESLLQVDNRGTVQGPIPLGDV